MLAQDEKVVLQTLRSDPLTIRVIAWTTGMSMGYVMIILGKLERQGMVKPTLEGKWYDITQEGLRWI